MAVERCDHYCLERSGNGFWQRLAFALRWLGTKIQRWDQLSEQRRQLRAMDDRLLKDIGLSRVDAERIAGRKFWNDPLQTGEQLDERYRSCKP